MVHSANSTARAVCIRAQSGLRGRGQAPAGAPRPHPPGADARAARVRVQPVPTRSSTSRIRCPSSGPSACSAKRRPTAATRWAEFDRALARARRRGRRSPSGRPPGPAGSGTARRRGRRSGSAGSGDSTTTMPSTGGRQSPSTSTTALHERQRDRPVRGRRGEQLAQRLAVAEVGEPGDRPALLGALGDLALEVDAEVGRARSATSCAARPPRRAATAGRSASSTAASETSASTASSPPQLSQRPQSAASGSSSWSRRKRIRHRSVREVVEHRLLLALAGLAHPAVALLVVGPRLPGRLPAAAHPAYGAVDVEHLEHRLEAVAVEVDVRLQGGGAQRPALVGEHRQGLPDLLLAREGERGEVGPDVAVLDRRQQHDGGLVGAAAGAADLLVVGDRRRRARPC